MPETRIENLIGEVSETYHDIDGARTCSQRDRKNGEKDTWTARLLPVSALVLFVCMDSSASIDMLAQGTSKTSWLATDCGGDDMYYGKILPSGTDIAESKKSFEGYMCSFTRGLGRLR